MEKCEIAQNEQFHLFPQCFLCKKKKPLGKKNTFRKTWKNVELLKMSNFTFFHNVFYAVCTLKSFNSHISVIVCSLFEFGTVSKWCIREWVNPFPNDRF